MQTDHRMISEVLVDQSYWDKSYERMTPTAAHADDPVRKWIITHVKAVPPGKNALEVGCFPGRYLAVIGERGYRVNGVDLTPGVLNMPEAFRRMGLTAGTFERADFLSHQYERPFDLVCSFGFIEHFADWRAILRRHAELVAPGGLLVIETPNFRGTVQNLFHRWLDAENYARHNPYAMDPHAWAAEVEALGFTVHYSGWFGRFEFWSDSPQRGPWQWIGSRVLRVLQPWLKKRPEGHPATSPYCGLVAQRA